MAKKPVDSTVQENSTPSVDPQKKYLMDQFGDLMEQVGDGFGGPLQEELISRLQQTISDFHEEVNEMLSKLKENSEKRHEKLKEIWDNPDAPLENQDPDQSEVSEPQIENKEMSEWEKKLESADAKLDEKPAKEEPPKKKGFFGRKKK
jgi:gas vesicle protein